VLARVGDPVAPRLEIQTLWEPVGSPDRPRLFAYEELALDPIQPSRIRSHKLRFHVLRNARLTERSNPTPRVGSVVVIDVRGPDAHVFEEPPLPEGRHLIGLE